MQLANYGGYFLESVDGVNKNYHFENFGGALCLCGLKFSVEARRGESS